MISASGGTGREFENLSGGSFGEFETLRTIIGGRL